VTEQTQEELTINVDGEAYPFSSLNDQQKEMVMVYEGWRGELRDARNEIAKLELAVSGLGERIAQSVRLANEAATAEAATADATEVEAPEVAADAG
jgi:hypothetical protein